MARFKYAGTWFDAQNAVVTSGTITIYLAGTTTLATAYNAETGAALTGSQTTTSSTDGSFHFWVDDGDYAITQKFRYIGTKTGFNNLDNEETDDLQIIVRVTIVEADISDLGTAIALVADNLSVFAATTSLQLLGIISDETGSGALVFATTPTLVTPELGAATATSIVASSNYLMEGYSTGRNVLRSVKIQLGTGATPGTNINISGGSSSDGFNIPTITDATDLPENSSEGSFALNTGATVITMDITENVVGIISASIKIHDLNNSSTTAGDIWFPAVATSSSNITLSLIQTGGSAGEDLRTILQAADRCDIHIVFVTST